MTRAEADAAGANSFPSDGVTSQRSAAPGRSRSRRRTSESAALVGRLELLRALLRELAETASSGCLLSEAQLAAINTVIGRSAVRSQLEVTDDGRYLVDFRPIGGEWVDRVERELAGSFSSMLRRSHPTRIRVCADESCGKVFYDATRSRTRRWCDSRTCGNRARVRRHRATAES